MASPNPMRRIETKNKDKKGHGRPRSGTSEPHSRRKTGRLEMTSEEKKKGSGCIPGLAGESSGRRLEKARGSNPRRICCCRELGLR